MKIELLISDPAVLALRPEWEQLWRHSSDGTPFQSPAWLIPWWSVFGTTTPIIATLRIGSRLAGVLPLYILDEPPAQKLLPIGAGITDYHDVLLAPDTPDGAAQSLLDAALAAARDYGVTECALLDLRPQSPLRTTPVPSGWKERPSAQIPCPVLTVPASCDVLRNAIPAGRLRDIRQYQHRATRIGGWSIETANAQTTDELVTALIGLHQARWHSRGESGLFDDCRVRTFHRRAAPELHRTGLLRLQVLRLAGDIAAACYALLDGKRILFYMSGFDPSFAQQSPGTILFGNMVAHAVREGRRELHFLRGAEHYKYAWGAVDRLNSTRLLVPL